MDTHAAELPRPPIPILGGEVVTLSREADITVSVYSVKDQQGQRTLTRFKVRRDALISNSEYFTATLQFNSSLSTGSPDHVELKDDDADALHVWLIYMQEVYENERAREEEQEDRPSKRTKMSSDYASDEYALFQREGVIDTDIGRLWRIIDAADKYLLDASILQGFFDNWYRKNVDMTQMGDDFARQLALPCYMFGHAQGFADVTKWLAYNFAGHITEKRPQGFRWKHMRFTPPDFVRPMNHARCGLKTCLHRGIWDEIGALLERGSYACTCRHWATTAGHYFAALVKTEAYPLEKTFSRNSINGILTWLKAFEMPTPAPGTPLCRLCSVDWNEEVARARINTFRYFDGLCIDCMDRSRLKRDDTDVDYWRQLESVDGRWDTNCRVRHDEPTWYVSWCGRDEHKQKLLERHRERNPRSFSFSKMGFRMR